MKTCLNRIAAAAIVGALAIPAAPALAASENAAVVINNETCTGFLPTADGKAPTALDQYFTESTHKAHRLNSKGGGKSTLCSFDVPDELTPSSVRKAEGFACYAFDKEQITYESQMIVTPGGRGFLICRSD